MQPWRPAVRLAIGIADPCQAGPPNLQSVMDDVVEHAATNGIRLLDTADAYAPADGPFGLGETVARRAVERLPPSIRPTIMTKGGHTRPAGGWATDGGHAYLRAAARASRDRLGQGCLDLYTFHRPDPAVEFTESLDALRSLVVDGVARTIALSNVSPEQIHQGREALGEALVAVQNELSVLNPAALREVATCEQLGLTFFAWSPLGGTGARVRLGRTVAERVRHPMPYTPQEWALAWLWSLSECVVPVVGVSRPASIDSCLHALTLRIPDGEGAWPAGSGS